MSKLALLGGHPLRTKPWPQWPLCGAEEKANLLAALESRQWGIGGEWIGRLEEIYADIQDASYGIACANGTVALEVALLAANVGFGDEVITTPYTFVATTVSILRVNAIPVYADIDEATGNLDPDSVEERITERTRAIMPVHVAGVPVDIDRFEAIGRKRNIPIIYDAAHGWGSQWQGKGVGAYGTFSTYSFQSSKNITSGEGGIILTCDQESVEMARTYVNCGRSAGSAWYEHFFVGANLRLNEFAAAVLVAQLGRLDAQLSLRARNAHTLEKLLQDCPGIATALRDPRVTRQSHHLMCMRFDNEAWDGLSRERFIAALNAEGVPVSRGWPLMHQMGFFAKERLPGPYLALRSAPGVKRFDYSSLHLPHAEKLSNETSVWLHQSHLLGTESDMKDVAGAIMKVRENLKELLAAHIPDAA